MLYRTLCIALLLLLGCAVGVRADATNNAIDPASFATFTDEQINAAISHNDFPGAAVVLVENGTIIFSRGYGVADLQTRRPIDPDLTGFRVGSISKVMTATAILQLADRGKISLTDDIQKYLSDVPLGEAGRGVTFHNVLTHTDGFEVGWSIGGAVRDERDAISLQQFLQTHLPRRIMPPGKMYVYSDVGMSLAGHVVENVSGRPLAEYVGAEIFTPLGMMHSTFAQPLPPALTAHLAIGYRRFKGQDTAIPFEYVLSSPSAGMTTTAGDMARFIIAYLNRGEIDGQRILKPETADMMRNQQFTQHPALPGTAYGLYEHIENGQRALQHGGSMLGYHSLLLILPEHRAGLFVATNGYGDDSFDPFIDAFFKQLFPAPTSQPATPKLTAPTTTASLSSAPTDLTGRYRYVQYPHFSLAKVSILAGLVEEMRVRQQSDGTIIVDQGLKGPWQNAGPLLYGRGEEKLAFLQDDSGRTIGAVYDTWAFEKIRWYEGRRAQTVLIAGLSGWFVIGLLHRIVVRVRGQKATPGNKFAAAACAINLLFLIGLSYSVWRDDVLLWYLGLPRWVAAILLLPWVGIVLTVIALMVSVREMICANNRRRPRLIPLLTLAALMIFPAFCWYWNLLAWPGVQN